MTPVLGEDVRIGIGRRAVGSTKASASALRTRDRLRDRVVYEDRSVGSDTVVVLIGYKARLWALVVPALARALPEGGDVCLVSPGLSCTELSQVARREGWSYLFTTTDDAGLAQHVAIDRHPAASTVVKVDEDMFLLEDSIAATIDFLGAVEREGVLRPFCSPMIPLDGTCHRPLLAQLGKPVAFEEAFGRPALGNFKVAVATDPRIARWMWEEVRPLREVQAAMHSTPVELMLTSIQFSIGLIVFRREFWYVFGMFPVACHRLALGKSALGADERHLRQAAVTWFRPDIVCPHALAGHFSFGPQYGTMVVLLDHRPELFSLN